MDGGVHILKEYIDILRILCHLWHDHGQHFMSFTEKTSVKQSMKCKVCSNLADQVADQLADLPPIKYQMAISYRFLLWELIPGRSTGRSIPNRSVISQMPSLRADM